MAGHRYYELRQIYQIKKDTTKIYEVKAATGKLDGSGFLEGLGRLGGRTWTKSSLIAKMKEKSWMERILNTS